MCASVHTLECNLPPEVTRPSSGSIYRTYLFEEVVFRWFEEVAPLKVPQFWATETNHLQAVSIEDMRTPVSWWRWIQIWIFWSFWIYWGSRIMHEWGTYTGVIQFIFCFYRPISPKIGLYCFHLRRYLFFFFFFVFCLCVSLKCCWS